MRLFKKIKHTVELPNGEGEIDKKFRLLVKEPKIKKNEKVPEEPKISKKTGADEEPKKYSDSTEEYIRKLNRETAIDPIALSALPLMKLMEALMAPVTRLFEKKK